MADTNVLHPASVIDRQSIGLYQLAVVVLCGLVMFIDGFDTQAISYMAPRMAKEWGLTRDALAPVFSSALAGLMIGYLALSPLSDRFGHRNLLLASTVFFSFFTFLMIFAGNVDDVMVLRFLTGLGLGAAAPSAVALTGEYSPARVRATAVLAIYCGFSLGFVAAGAAAAALIPTHGWRALLWLGSLTPLALTVALYLWLPESLLHMIRTGVNQSRIRSILRRIDPDLPAEGAAISATHAQTKRSAVIELFRGGLAAGTLLLWFVYVLNLAEFYALQSWMPSILSSLNFSLDQVVLATSLTTAGGIAAAFVVGPAMDNIGPYVSLATLYAAGIVFTALVGVALSHASWLLFVAAFFAGFCISGGQKSAIALAAVYYPVEMRSTGVGWALGMGRIGGIAGPMIIGLLLSWHFPAPHIFYAAALPMLLASASIAAMGAIYGARRNRSKAAPVLG